LRAPQEPIADASHRERRHGPAGRRFLDVVVARHANSKGSESVPTGDDHLTSVAISNHRLLDIDDGKVTFRWKDYALGKRHRKMTLDATEFIRRFLLHVFPKVFVRIRYYGFLANRRRKTNLDLCRTLLGNPPPVTIDTRTLAAAGDDEPGRELSDTASADDNASRPRCPACTKGRLVRLCKLRPFETFQPRAAGGDTAPT
jgi:hypothetical protein